MEDDTFFLTKVGLFSIHLSQRKCPFNWNEKQQEYFKLYSYK